MAKKLQGQSGFDQSGDRAADQSAAAEYIGTGAATASPVRKAITAAYQNASAIDVAKAAADDIIDMEDFDTLIVTVDYAKSAGTSCLMRAMYGDADADAAMLTQEAREDNSTALLVKYEDIEHEVRTTSGTRQMIIKRVAKFVKLQFKSGGAPDANDKIAVTHYGQRRER